MWKVGGTKCSAHEPATYLMCVQKNSRKSDFFGKTLRTQKFSTANFSGPVPMESLCTQDSENIVGLGDLAYVSKL